MNYIHIIITTLITGTVTYFFTTYRERKSQKIKDYNKAAALFRSEFTHLLQILDHPSDGTTVDNEISKFIDNQERALIEFSAYLSNKERENINSAWKEYACTNPSFSDKVDLIKYFSKERNEAQRLRKLALQRCKKLRECAKPK